VADLTGVVPRLPGARSAAGWIALGGLASVGAGVAAHAEPTLALDVALACCAAAAIALRPFDALIIVLVVRATASSSVSLDLVLCVSGGLALAFVARRLPAKGVLVPLVALLLFTLPFVPLLPSPDEGRQPSGLFLPALGIRYADAPSTEILQWLRIGAAAAALGLAAWTVRDRRRLDWVVVAILAAASYPVVKGLQQLVSGSYVHTRAGFNALSGPFYHPNYFAFYLVVVLAVAVAAMIEMHSLRARLPLAALVAASTVCLAFTYTRAAWLGFGVFVLLMALFSYRRLLAVAAVAILIAAIAVPSLAGEVNHRINEVSNPTSGADDSWGWRVGEWKRMFPHGVSHPLVGNGFGSYTRLTYVEFGALDPTYSTRIEADRTKRGFGAHNDYLKMFVETGVTGFLLWVGMLVGAAVTMARARRVPGLGGYASAGFAMIVAFMGMSFSDNIQAYTAVLFYALAFVGAVAGAAYGIRARRAPAGGPTGTPSEPHSATAR
jgi:O-antigen ligase